MGELADVIREMMGKSEPRYPVELATVIGDGAKTGQTRVAIHRPDGSLGEEKDVWSAFVVWPGLIVRVTTLRAQFGDSEEAISWADADTYAASSTQPVMTQEHGQTHGYEQGDETTWLHPYQNYPLRVQAYSGLTVRVQPGLFYASGAFDILIDSVDVNMTASQPAASDERWVLLSITSTKAITLTNGAAAPTVLRSSIPSPPAGEYPIGAIKIAHNDTSIVRAQIDDLRHLRPFVPDILPAIGSAFQRLRVVSGGSSLEFFTDQAGILVILDGGGADLATGSKGYLTIPFACNIIGWYCLGDNASNQIVVDVKWESGFPAAGALPSTASIAGSEKPTLSTAASNSDLALTTWTQQVLAQGDVLEFNIDSVAGTKPQRVSITLVVEKQ